MPTCKVIFYQALAVTRSVTNPKIIILTFNVLIQMIANFFYYYFSTMADRRLCHKCGNTFLSDKTLKIHAKKHDKKYPYRCYGVLVCDKTHFQRHR